MSNDLSHWLTEESYTYEEVCLLLAGIDPMFLGRIDTDENDSYTEKGLQQLQERTTIEHVNLLKFFQRKLATDQMRKTIEFTTSQYYDGITHQISKDSILKWASGYGFDFPKGCPIKGSFKPKVETSIEHLLRPQHEFYSDDLSVAIETWKELVEKGVSDGETFKKAAERIISRIRPAWKPTRVERIGRVVNCNPGTTEERKPYQSLAKA